MTIYDYIKTTLFADQTFARRCKASRFFVMNKSTEDQKAVDFVAEEEFPYVILTEQDDSPVEKTSTTFYDETLLDLAVYDKNQANGRILIKRARELLRADQPTQIETDDGTVVLFEKRGSQIEVLPGLIYMRVDEYAVQRQRAR